MTTIMQDYGEVVCIMGSAANHNNISVFLQADASLAIGQSYESFDRKRALVKYQFQREVITR